MDLKNILDTYRKGPQCLKEKNCLQIALIDESELEAVEWVKTYAARFAVVYGEGKRELGTIKDTLYNKEIK